MLELSPDDRYQLRKMQLDVDKRGLDLQKAKQDLERMVLELEYKYGLIAEAKTIDSKTATVKEAVPGRNGNGHGDSEMLLTAVVEEASA